jgi:Lrp/AsnC family transcriptional regulator, leucine-responsive regulatory protein
MGIMSEIWDREAMPMRLNQLDRALLNLLQQDAWRTISELSAIVGVSRATVKHRIDLMRQRGVIKKFTVELNDTPSREFDCGGAFFLLKLKRSSCRVVYASINGWPELLGCWSIAGELDMIVLISAISNMEVERLRDILARHPEVKTLQTLSILREWSNKTDNRNMDILDGLKLPNGLVIEQLHTIEES